MSAPAPQVCAACGGVLDPVLGRLIEASRVDWANWREGHYEHRERPALPHAPKPIAQASYVTLRPVQVVG